MFPGPRLFLQTGIDNKRWFRLFRGPLLRELRECHQIRVPAGTFTKTTGAKSEADCDTCAASFYCVAGQRDSCTRGYICQPGSESAQGFPSPVECDTNTTPPFYFSRKNICEPCPDFPVVIFIVFIVLFLMASYFFYFHLDVKNSSLCMASVLQLLNFFQYLNLSATIQVAWPALYIHAMNFLRFFMFDIDFASPPECINDDITWYHKFFGKFIFCGILMPVSYTHLTLPTKA